MAPPTDTGRPAPAGPARLAATVPGRSGGPAAFSLAVLAALYLAQPARGDSPHPPLWFPAAGVALALVAWFGARAALIPLAAGLAAALYPRGNGASALDALGDGAAAALEALAGCWLFLRVGRGARRLSEPRSAAEFLLLVAGVAAALGAAGRAALAAAAGTPLSAADVTAFWLAQSLGLLVVAPPLLVGLTPWMVRHGLTPDDPPDGPPLLPGPVGADSLSAGDVVEIVGLALGAGGLGLLLALAPGARVLSGWQVWGAPLLLIVWASLRQGICGGAVVTCAAVAVPLVALAAGPPPGTSVLLLQGNLLAQAGTGLLVAASASWLRASERRYRQLVEHVPVVVYSVRLTGTPPAAEVTLVSAASASLLGCAPDQFLGDHGRWLAHVHPDDREVYRAALTQLERQDGAVTCEYRLAPVVPSDWREVGDLWAPGERTSGVVARARAAGIRWVRDTLAPHRDAEGRLTGWEGVVTDVTEQRVLADDLRRASSMLHALVNNLPAGVFFVQGAQGRPVLVNARARQLLGQREDATLDRLAAVYRLHRPDGKPYPDEELPVARALRTGASTMCDDVVVHRPDGRRVPLVTWAAPVRLTGDGHDAAVWVLQDLTALHQAEAARRDTEGRLRAVVETMGEALVVLDTRGGIVDANPAAAGLFGCEPAALRGRPLAGLGWNFLREDGSPLPPDDHPARAAQRTGRPVRSAALGLRRDGGVGATRWVLVNAMPLGSPAAGVVATFADVTAYRQGREGAGSSEERYRGLVESLPVGVVQTDRGLRLTYFNPSAEEMTGFSAEEIATPEAVASRIHPEDMPAVCALAGAALSGRPGRGECRYRAKDGAEKAAHIFVEPRRERGEVVGVTALLVDTPHDRPPGAEPRRSHRSNGTSPVAVPQS